MKLKIGLDLDGVIIVHAKTKIQLAKQNGYFLKPADTTSEIMKKLMPLDVYRAIQKDIYGKEGLSSKSIKDAKRTIKKIAKTYFDLYIISRRLSDGREFALQWLKNNNFFPP